MFSKKKLKELRLNILNYIKKHKKHFSNFIHVSKLNNALVQKKYIKVINIYSLLLQKFNNINDCHMSCLLNLILNLISYFKSCNISSCSSSSSSSNSSSSSSSISNCSCSSSSNTETETEERECNNKLEDNCGCKIERNNDTIIYLQNSVSTSKLIVKNVGLLDDNIEYINFENMNNINFSKKSNIIFQTSTSLISILNKIQSKPNLRFISPISISSNTILTERTNKNLYRLSCPSTYYIPIFIKVINNITPIINNPDIFLIYEENDNASINEKNLLYDQLTTQGYNVILKPISTDYITDINNMLNEITLDNNRFSCLSASDDQIIEYFHNRVNNYNYGYFIEYFGSLTDLGSNLTDRYYFVIYQSVYERNVAKLVNNFGLTNTYLGLVDCINMANSNNINDVIGSYGYLYFNEVGDRNFPFYYVYKWNGSEWNSEIIYYELENEYYYLERYNINNFTIKPSLLDTYSHYNTKCGDICFILDKSLNDDRIRKTINYFGYKYKIVNITDNSNNPVSVNVLKNLYNQNYKIFIGLNTTNLLTHFKSFFDTYKDTVLISLYSSGESLNNRLNNNIYRMIPSDDNLYPIYIDFINSNSFNKVNFIIQDSDIYSQSLYNGILNLLNPSLLNLSFNVNSNTTSSDYDNIISSCDIDSNTITIICAINDNILRNIYTRLNNNISTFINGGSPSVPKVNDIIFENAKNCYFILFNPLFEKNIKKLLDTLLDDAALPLFDAVNMAINISKTNNFNQQIGAYGYLYFQQNGDRNFHFYNIDKFNGFSWEIFNIYNLINNIFYKF